MTEASLIDVIVLCLVLLTVLVHVESVPNESEDIESPGLVHPVHQVLGVPVPVVVVVVVVVPSVVPCPGL